MGPAGLSGTQAGMFGIAPDAPSSRVGNHIGACIVIIFGVIISIFDMGYMVEDVVRIYLVAYQVLS